MSQQERLQVIKKAILAERKVTVSELSKQLNVTEETIRRDLDRLQAEHILNRTYGGAVLNLENHYEKIDFIQRADKSKEEKQTIAHLVSEVINEKMTISADASSTVAETVIALKNKASLAVLTTSVRIITELIGSEINIISVGGIVDKSNYSMIGKIARGTIANYNTDVALISCKALSLSGVFDSREEEAEIKQAMIKNSQKVILLADHSKFNKVAFVKLVDLKDIDVIITDRDPGREWQEYMNNINVKLIFPNQQQ